MYKISTEDFNGIDKIKLFDTLSGEYVSIIPSFGGNINELTLQKNGTLHDIIAGDKNLETLSGNGQNYYRGAKLSPFPNRINQGKYTFNGIDYQLEQNAFPHALHGLIWNSLFVVKEQYCCDSFARLVLICKYDSFHIGFPFSYEIELEYKLQAEGFSCLTKILNTSDCPIPIGDGWHPYFTMGGKINRLKLKLPACKQIEMDETLIPTGKYFANLPFRTPQLLNDTTLDCCFELNESESFAETRLIDEQKNSSIVVWQKTTPQGYKFIQVYTPPDRNSIAIEPTSCSPDAFNNQNGLLTLLPNVSTEFLFGVRLE